MVLTIRDFVKNSTGIDEKSATVIALNNSGDYALLYCHPTCVLVEFDVKIRKKKSAIGIQGNWATEIKRVMLSGQETYTVSNDEDNSGASKTNVDIDIILVRYNIITGPPAAGSDTPENSPIDAGPSTGSQFTDPDINVDKTAWTWLYVIIALVFAGLIGYVLYRMVKDGKFKDLKSKAHSVAEKIKGD